MDPFHTVSYRKERKGQADLFVVCRSDGSQMRCTLPGPGLGLDLYLDLYPHHM